MFYFLFFTSIKFEAFFLFSSKLAIFLLFSPSNRPDNVTVWIFSNMRANFFERRINAQTFSLKVIRWRRTFLLFMVNIFQREHVNSQDVSERFQLSLDLYGTIVTTHTGHKFKMNSKKSNNKSILFLKKNTDYDGRNVDKCIFWSITSNFKLQNLVFVCLYATPIAHKLL